MKNNLFLPEELLGVTAWLTELYTGRESTSVTYERANQLMGAVMFCIEEYCSSMQLPVSKEHPVSAKEAYDNGYRAVLERVERTRKKYNELLLSFDAYGNRNYEDTVKKGLKAFFLYYDARFDPTNTIITMDYPVLHPIEQKLGIDAVEAYLDEIIWEQHYLQKLDRNYVIQCLRDYNEDYQDYFDNLCEIVMRD